MADEPTVEELLADAIRAHGAAVGTRQIWQRKAERLEAERNALAARLAAAEKVVAARALREMADTIDRGPTFPLPPSVISALIRERADVLDRAAVDAYRTHEPEPEQT